MWELKQALLPLKPIVRLRLPKGAVLLSIIEWKQVKVITYKAEVGAPEVTRELRLIEFINIDSLAESVEGDFSPADLSQILEQGVSVGTTMQYGWGRVWHVFDLGESDAPGAQPCTKPYSPEPDPNCQDVGSTRYWHHPESSCVGKAKPGELLPDEQGVELIDEKTYIRLSAEYDDL